MRLTVVMLALALVACATTFAEQAASTAGGGDGAEGAVGGAGGSSDGGGAGGSGGGPITPVCDARTLFDDFDDNTFDRGLWDRWEDPNFAVEESEQRMVWSLPMETGYAGVYWKERYDLRDCDVLVEVVEGAVKPGTEMFFSARTDRDNELAMYVYDGKLYAGLKLSGSWVEEQELAFNAVAHRYLRIEDSGGMVRLQHSGDAVAWTTLHEVASPAWVESIVVHMQAGNFTSQTTRTVLSFDNLNRYPEQN